MQWRRVMGHEFGAVPSSAQADHWCPECAGVRRGSLDDLRALGNRVRREGWCPHCAGRLRLTTEEMQALARERAGLVSTVYINSERETPVTIRLQGPHPVGEVLRVMIAAGRPSGMARSEYPGPLDVEAWAGSLRALVDRTH